MYFKIFLIKVRFEIFFFFKTQFDVYFRVFTVLFISILNYTFFLRLMAFFFKKIKNYLSHLYWKITTYCYIKVLTGSIISSLFHLFKKENNNLLSGIIIVFFFSFATANFFLGVINSAGFFCIFLIYLLTITFIEKNANVKYIIWNMSVPIAFIQVIFNPKFFGFIDRLFVPLFIILGLTFLKLNSVNVVKKLSWLWNLYFQIFFQKKYKVNFKRVFFLSYFFFRESMLYNNFILLSYLKLFSDDSFVSKIEIIFLIVLQLTLWLFVINLINKYFPIKGQKNLICCGGGPKLKWAITGITTVTGTLVYYNLKSQNLNHQASLEQLDLKLKYKYRFLSTLDLNPERDSKFLQNVLNDNHSITNPMVQIDYQKHTHPSVQIGNNNKN